MTAVHQGTEKVPQPTNILVLTVLLFLFSASTRPRASNESYYGTGIVKGLLLTTHNTAVGKFYGQMDLQGRCKGLNHLCYLSIIRESSPLHASASPVCRRRSVVFFFSFPDGDGGSPAMVFSRADKRCDDG